ncbi:MAG: 3-deoxy-D-manno-octulosonic acid transferase [Planctomycetaceae bacterium]|nr:3-deoxy-D-manno-octulosonic acid transferase [Planctomycetaceae bacterium]
MRYVLNTLYLITLLAAAPWLLWVALRRGKYRRGWGAKLLGRVPRSTGEDEVIWFHAVSAGEVNLLVPLVAAWRVRYPHWTVCISTTTRTGYDLARERFSTLSVFYCPLDFSWAVSAALRRVRPTLLILAELELWPNLIAAARRQRVRVAVVNGRMSDRSLRGYRRLRLGVARMLCSIDVLAVQTEEYRSRFIALGARASAVHVTGSVKFDGAQTDRQNPATRRLATLAGIAPGERVFLAGSTQRGEELAAIETYQRLRTRYPELRLILVPRHPERFPEVAELLDRSGLCWARRSTLPDVPLPVEAVLLVDRVGELGAWWGTAQIAFVGGSLGRRGGQNMIEPAAYGAAVCFGPNTRNFRAVVSALLRCEAAVVIRNRAELERFVERCLVDPAYGQALGARAQQLVGENLGATVKTIDLLGQLPGLVPPQTGRSTVAAA